jgi:hypothetical protein
MKKPVFRALGVVMFASVLVASSFLARHAVSVYAQNTIPACPTTLTTNLTSGAILQGIAQLNLGVPTTTVSSLTINKVLFMADGVIIGEARPLTSSPNAWNMPWATQLSTPGVKQINAKVLFNGTSTCQTTAIPVMVQNTTASSSVLQENVVPASWSGLTNTSIDMTANVVLSGGEVPPATLQQYTYFEWNTNIGSVSAVRQTARFSSGATAGNGRVIVKAMYGGKEVLREVPISVASQLATSGSTTPPSTTTPAPSATSPAPTSTTGSTETTSVPLTPEQTKAQITSQLASQPEVLSCANINLTADRIQQLRDLALRLTATEFEAIKGCFATTNFVVPSAYAPVAPDTLKAQIKESSESRINNATTQSDDQPASGGSPTKSLRFKGTAKPNSDVLLYVFSEPLVLYAKADANGSWEYDLVDPLEPGNHEAYSVVESTDGSYKRSSPFAFLIQTAQASAENPNGYSLSVQTVSSLAPTASKRQVNLYVIGASIIVLLVLGSGSFFLVRTLRHVPKDQDETNEKQL